LFRIRKVKSLNHLTKLKRLHAQGKNCGIDQDGIQNCLELEELNIVWNPNIKSTNHLVKLRNITK